MTGGTSSRLSRFAPGLAALLAYRKADLRFDVVAGLSVAAVALPVGIAYAEIARVPAVFGIYSAIFPLFAYALFGSSRQLMTGPDAATCIMAASALGAIAGGDPQHYLGLMVVLTAAHRPVLHRRRRRPPRLRRQFSLAAHPRRLPERHRADHPRRPVAETLRFCQQRERFLPAGRRRS